MSQTPLPTEAPPSTPKEQTQQTPGYSPSDAAAADYLPTIPKISQTSEATTTTIPPAPAPAPQESHRSPSSAGGPQDTEPAVAKHVRFQQQGDAGIVQTPPQSPIARQEHSPEHHRDVDQQAPSPAPQDNEGDDHQAAAQQQQQQLQTRYREIPPEDDTSPSSNTQQFCADLPAETRERMVRSGADAQIVRAGAGLREGRDDDDDEGCCSIL